MTPESEALLSPLVLYLPPTTNPQGEAAGRPGSLSSPPAASFQSPERQAPPKSLAPLSFLLPQLCSDSVGLLPHSEGPLPPKAFSSDGPPQPDLAASSFRSCSPFGFRRQGSSGFLPTPSPTPLYPAARQVPLPPPTPQMPHRHLRCTRSHLNSCVHTLPLAPSCPEVGRT